jgi:hypothetical protein
MMLALFCNPAFGHGVHSLTDPILGPATPLANGLFEVQLRTGGTLLTHGADGPIASAPLPSTAERAPVCSSAFHQHLLYGHPLTSPDRLAEVVETIRSSMRRANAALDREAIESGRRHADYRVLCDGGGEIKVDTFLNATSNSFADIVDAARLAGFTDTDTDYTIFYDDPTPEACGVGSYTPDERLVTENANNTGGGYAVLYADCWDAATLMHENGHNQGAVQPNSPNSTGSGGHCRDEEDVMCYSDGGDRDAGMFLRCDGGQRFDCGHDDYFDIAPQPGEYLHSHWNLGSPLNRFIGFTDLTPGEDAGLVEDPAPDPADDLGDDFTDDALLESEGLRIVRRALRLRSGRVSVVLACAPGRETPCSGDVRLNRGRKVVARKAVDLDSGRRRTVRLKVSPRIRASRLRVTAYEVGADATVARTLPLRRR